MLNEAWRLLQALEKSGIKRDRKHKRIQTPGRGFPCLRVCLDKEGKVFAVYDVNNDEWPTWTVMEGNQNSFPVVRIQEPLLHLQRDHNAWTKLGFTSESRRRRRPKEKVRLNVLESLLKDWETLHLSNKSLALWQRLRDQKAKELMECIEKGSIQMESVTIFAERFKKAAKKPEALLEQVAKQSIARLCQGRLNNIDAVEQLLVGKGPPDEEGKRPNMTVQLAFDIENAGDYGPKLYSQDVRELIVELLPQDPSWKSSTRRKIKTEAEGIDALTGIQEILEKKNFPKVDLPVPSLRRHRNTIGRKRFPIASMFSAASCNMRYGMTDARIFPLAKKRGIELKEALEEITADSRRGSTWQHVASGRFETQRGRKIEKFDLLIAYVEEKPSLDVKTAGYFGQGLDITETKFEVDASVLCEALRGIARNYPQSKINIFLIREVSKGQTQIVLAESPTVQEVLNAAERWQHAARHNVPEVSLYLPEMTFNKKKFRAVENARPQAPYPDQVVRLLSYQWVRNGASPKGPDGKPQKAKQAVVGPGMNEVLTLMLRTEGKWEAAAKRLLGLLIARVTPMLIGLFGAKHAFGPRQSQGKPEPLSNYPRGTRETALRAVAVLGILLDSLGSKKEDYMKNAPYQVGQILALADTLHKDYCIVVRKGQMPNTLIGTALMRRALDNPAGALADLGERIIEYLRWAKIVQVPIDWSNDDKRRIAVNEARKKLRQYQPLAKNLGSCDLPRECDDVMKAQLLLGFLSTPPEEEVSA